MTLNTEQRDVIEDALDRRLKNDPCARQCMEACADGPEPFFIKNLENVQGDERDVIFISVTYGPAPNGRVYQRFGPINSATGHRRLNVLFTRAKRRVVVFSSMRSDDILVQPDSSWGVRALKGYLAYAESGVLEQAQLTDRLPDSDFEIEVAQALKTRGYDLQPQVGVAGYFIDLAVQHPEKLGAYILAVECDGATYHSSRSARDRDRLRQEILESLGWNVHRIWSTDWFKDSERETDRLVNRIQQILQEEQSALPKIRHNKSPENPVVNVTENPALEEEHYEQPISERPIQPELFEQHGTEPTTIPINPSPGESHPTEGFFPGQQGTDNSTALENIDDPEIQSLARRAEEIVKQGEKGSFTPQERSTVRRLLGLSGYGDLTLARKFLQHYE